jgi:hypothetical protein
VKNSYYILDYTDQQCYIVLYLDIILAERGDQYEIYDCK